MKIAIARVRMWLPIMKKILKICLLRKDRQTCSEGVTSRRPVRRSVRMVNVVL